MGIMKVCLPMAMRLDCLKVMPMVNPMENRRAIPMAWLMENQTGYRMGKPMEFLRTVTLMDSRLGWCSDYHLGWHSVCLHLAKRMVTRMDWLKVNQKGLLTVFLQTDWHLEIQTDYH